MFRQLGQAIRWEVDFLTRKGTWRLWTDRAEYYIRMVYADHFTNHDMPRGQAGVDDILAIGRLRDMVRAMREAA